MAKIDQFESIFRSASKEAFEPEAIEFARVAVVTDLDLTNSQTFVNETKRFLEVFSDSFSPEWKLISGEQFSSVSGLLEKVNEFRPDLICTYRNLHIPASEHPYSLGVYVDVLTQATTTPILLMPRIEDQTEFEIDQLEKTGTARVMAITDHLAGDHRLVSFASTMVKSGGKLFLTHVEDRANFDRVVAAIDRIADIDSDVAKQAILKQLLAEPTDFIESCKARLQESFAMEVESIVTVGHLLRDHLKLVEDREIDLLVLHTKDDDQLAMHGLAYPLAVEMRKRPLLLI